MYRIRFKTKSEDYRPVVWPVKHPYWCSGSGGDYAIMISYADNEKYIKDLWPEAYDLEVDEVDGYRFTERFPKPRWFDIVIGERKGDKEVL